MGLGAGNGVAAHKAAVRGRVARGKERGALGVGVVQKSWGLGWWDGVAAHKAAVRGSGGLVLHVGETENWV